MRLIVIIIVMFPVSVFAQDGFDGVPLGFGSSGIQSNVGSSSGALSVSIPLEDAIFPIALNYTASGIKVNQRPGIVGLGWNISTEFYVEREIRGLPDESLQGYCGPNGRGYELTKNFTGDIAYNIGQNIWDTEPDVFRFQAPGISGTFLLDPGKNVVKLTYDNFKIDFFLSSNRFTSFRITDTQGNIYTFDRRETKTQIVTSSSGSSSNTYDSRWYLTRIEKYNDRTISFNYTTSPKSENYAYPFEVFPLSDQGSKTHYANNITINWTQNYLTEVTFFPYRYNFNYVLENNDRVLRAIDCFYQHNPYATYQFNYGSFPVNNRARLENVELKNKDSRIRIASFSYYGDAAGEPNLPNYNSKDQDHWGYYNTNPHSNLFIFQGANRSSNLGRTRANTLKRVDYNSRGYEEYVYQLNQYDDNGTARNVGGLRVGEIRKSDGTSISSKTFLYNVANRSSGQIFGLPVYDKNYLLKRSIFHLQEQYKLHQTNSFRPLFDIYGKSVSYSQITENSPDGSRVVNVYYNYSDEYQNLVKHPTRRRVSFRKDNNNNNILLNNVQLESNDQIPYSPPNVYGNFTGAIKESYFYNINNQLVNKIENAYRQYSSNKTLYGLNLILTEMIQDQSPGYRREFYSGRYFINPRYYRLLKTETINYNPSNNSQNKKAIVDYQYHPDLLLPTRVESYLDGHYADRRVVQTVYKIDEYRDCFDNCISQCHQTYDPAVCPTGNQSCINTVEALRQGCIEGCNTSSVACLESKGLALNFIEHNLIELTSSTTELKGNTVLGRTINSFGNHANNNVRLNAVKSFIGTDQLVSEEAYFYNTDRRLNRTVDSIMGSSRSLILNSRGELLAEANNVNNNQIYYNGFEYTVGSGVVRANPSECKAGYHYFSGNYTVFFNPPSGTNYVISYWYRQNNQWKFISKNYTGSSMVLSEGDAIDEIRIHPVGVAMKTYTYDFYNGKTTSETDVNNVTTYTEYDDLSRVKLIRNSDFNILKNYEYQIR